jgi:hypothetical protein
MRCFTVDLTAARKWTTTLVIAAMIFQAGCFSRTLVKMEPPPERYPGIKLPVRAEIQLRAKTGLKASRGKKTVRRETDSLYGEIIAWDDNGLQVKARDSTMKRSLRWTYIIPYDEIQRIGCRGNGIRCGIQHVPYPSD